MSSFVSLLLIELEGRSTINQNPDNIVCMGLSDNDLPVGMHLETWYEPRFWVRLFTDDRTRNDVPDADVLVERALLAVVIGGDVTADGDQVRVLRTSNKVEREEVASFLHLEHEISPFIVDSGLGSRVPATKQTA